MILVALDSKIKFTRKIYKTVDDNKNNNAHDLLVTMEKVCVPWKNFILVPGAGTRGATPFIVFTANEEKMCIFKSKINQLERSAVTAYSCSCLRKLHEDCSHASLWIAAPCQKRLQKQSEVRGLPRVTSSSADWTNCGLSCLWSKRRHPGWYLPLFG